MGNKNFMRRYIMKCGKEGQSGFQIGNLNSASETALHVSFNIEKSDEASPNDAIVQIWNLSDNNLKILEGEDCIVELRAGYDDNIALVLVGAITSAITVRENADRMTELTVVDGHIQLRDAYITLSLNGKIDTKELYQKIATEMGMSVVFAKDLTFKSMPNGFSYVGKARDALHKVANYCGHSWTIQNQVIQITLPGRAATSSGYLLSSETGLIDIPKRIAIGTGTPTQYGWEVQYFLNGAIGIGDTVRLQSSTANGYFLVKKITIDGDNFDGDWICTAELIEVEAIAELDDAVTKANENKESGGIIKEGAKVIVKRTFTEGSKKKGYTYTGETFVCWHSSYDVLRVKGDKVVIGIGDTATATVNINDIERI